MMFFFSAGGSLYISIPDNCLEKADLDALLTEPHLSHMCNRDLDSSIPVPSVWFEGKREDFSSSYDARF